MEQRWPGRLRGAMAWMLGAAVIAAAAGCGSQSPKRETAPGLAIEGGKLDYLGIQFKVPCKFSHVEEILGRASRRHEYAAADKEPAVTVHVWDELGMLCFERPESHKVTELSLALGPRDPTLGTSPYDQLWPKNSFAGPITIDGVAVAHGSTPPAINASLANQPFEQLKKFPFSWNRRQNGLLVTIITDSAGKRIVECLVGD